MKTVFTRRTLGNSSVVGRPLSYNNSPCYRLPMNPTFRKEKDVCRGGRVFTRRTGYPTRPNECGTKMPFASTREPPAFSEKPPLKSTAQDHSPEKNRNVP